MKLVITKEDLRQAILKASGVDIENVTLDVQIEGWVRAKDYRLKATLPEKDEVTSIVKTDANMNVISIEHETKEKTQANTTTPTKKRRKRRKYTYTGPVDYESYKEEIIAFADSDEDKRKVASFGLTITCLKERYKKAIKKMGATDMVRFSQIDNEPYLVRLPASNE
ncbi:MAG: hypothetical protein K6F00_08450 [Lachnospiraceae bacterium]|nr:hypothetical protein [Lachnospiraceae bacterium]